METVTKSNNAVLNISDQEFFEALNLAGGKPKTKVCDRTAILLSQCSSFKDWPHGIKATQLSNICKFHLLTSCPYRHGSQEKTQGIH